MKIRGKLGVGFGMLLMITVVIAFFGIFFVVRIAQDTRMYGEQRNEAVRHAEELERQIMRYITEVENPMLDVTVNDVNAQTSRLTTIAIATMGILTAVGFIMGVAVAMFISKRITKPIHAVALAVGELTNGNLNVNIDKSNITNDETGILTRDVLGLVEVIRSIVDDLSSAHTRYIKEGDIYYTIDDSKYNNSFKEMIGLINNFLTTMLVDIQEIADTLNHISDGDFSKEVKHDVWVGEWVFIPNALGGLISNLRGVNTEVQGMIRATVKGDLHFRADETKFKGDWREIMEGLNNIAKAVDTPIQALMMALSEMKAGNFDLDSLLKKLTASGLETDVEKYSGVFNRMTTAVSVTMTDISSYITEISNDLIAISSGDLTTEITREYVGSFVSIKDSLNNISYTLNKTMSDIAAAADQVLVGSGIISNSAADLAIGAQEQAGSVQELNATIALLAEQTQKNAANAQNANKLSTKSADNAQEGNAAMKQTVEAMTQIKESSDNISKIIKTIQDIAFQTNLLALNASVEAARAGEHGKGFAVVADEVRTLAGRSQEAANETTTLIQDSIARVQSGSSISETTSQSLDAIVASSGNVSEIIASISASSQEQAEAISQISGGVEQIANVTQNNSAVSEETAAASEELNSQAEMLQHLVGYFKLQT